MDHEDECIRSLRSRVSKDSSHQSDKPDPPPSLDANSERGVPPAVNAEKDEEDLSILSANTPHSKDYTSHDSKETYKADTAPDGSSPHPTKTMWDYDDSDGDKPPSGPPLPPDDPTLDDPEDFKPVKTSKPEKPVVRSKINDKVHWDGYRSTFQNFEKLVEGHLLQVGAGYITDKAFQQWYMELGMVYCRSDGFYRKYRISNIQAQ